MNTRALKRFRAKLAADEPVYGMFVTLDAPNITDMGVAIGLDWIVLDAEHGHLDWGDLMNHLRGAVRSDTVVLIRLTELSAGLVKRALDIGADGFLIPCVETAEQVEEAVSYAHYPPRGVRGLGGERATAWGQAAAIHVQDAEENVLVVPMFESLTGHANVNEIVAVDGVEMFYFGPSDFSASAGFAGQWEGPGVAEKILEIKDAIRAAGKHCGVLSTSIEDLVQRRVQEFRMLGFGTDASLLLRSLHDFLASVGRDRKLRPSLDNDDTA